MEPFKSFEAALPTIIAENTSQLTRQRETLVDTFRAPEVFTAGPYTLRVEPYRTNNTDVTYDQQGSTALVLFEAVGHNLPRTIEEAGRTVPLFQLGDRITDQDDNTYEVVAPPYRRGKIIWLKLALRG